MTDRPAPEILQAIAGNVQDILRSHVQLARTEIREEIAEASRPAATVAAGLLLAVCGVGLVLLSAVYALALVLPAWSAALIVGSATTAAALLLVARGRAGLRGVNAGLNTTIASLKETFQWPAKQTR